MFDREGRLAEASAANVFLIEGDRIVTPLLNPDVFPGITRRVVLELASEAGLDAREVEIRREQLERADGVFVCSTLMELRGLSRLGDRELSTVELPAYHYLLDRFRAVTHG